jgi:hypothetical protein
MPYFCARLLVVCLVDDGKPRRRNTCDYPFILLKATDFADAFSRAIDLGRKQETKYKNSKQQSVRWAFVKVEQIWELGGNLDGQEVGSIMDVLITDEAISYRKRFNPKRHLPTFS